MEDNRSKLKQMLDSGEIRLEPLTYPQRELWEASPRAPADVANHICAYIQVRGKIPAQACEAGMVRVIERQEALRLSFLPARGTAVQMIRATGGKPAFAYRELTAEETEPVAQEEIMREIFLRPFDLLAGPLYRVELLQRGPRDQVLVLVMHHSISDGWTIGVFMQDLVTAYLHGIKGGKKPMPPVALTYSAWGISERAVWSGSELEARTAFWKRYLAGASRLWTFPRPAEPLAGPMQRWVTGIPADQAAALRKLTKRTGTTLFSTLLAAFQGALAEWTGVRDIVVGSPVANRSKIAAHETMGYFAGVVPIRGQVDPALSIEERVKATHENTVEAFSNAIPFVEIARALGETPATVRNPLFDVRFALQNHPIPDVSLPGLSFKLRMRSTGTTRFDLACELTEDGKALELVWLYEPTLFSRKQSDELDRIYRAHLAQLTGAAQAPPFALLGKS